MNELNVKIVLVTKTRSSEALPNEMVQQKNRYFIKVYHDAMLFPYEKKRRKIVNEERWHKKKQTLFVYMAKTLRSVEKRKNNIKVHIKNMMKFWLVCRLYMVKKEANE